MPYPRPSLRILIPTTPSLPPTSSSKATPSQIPLPPSRSPRPARERCLQCAVAGFRCSFTQIPPKGSTLSSQAQGKKQTSCMRCWRNGQEFCVLREKVEDNRKKGRQAKATRKGEVERIEVQWKYSVDGLDALATRDEVARLLTPGEERHRWALPVASDWQRKSLKPLSARFAAEQKAEEARMEAFKNLVGRKRDEESERESKQSEDKEEEEEEGSRGEDQELGGFI